MAIPDTFKAAVVPEAGAKPVVSDRSVAPLEADEVGIKITATAINPVDWKIQRNKFPSVKFPTVLGTDGAGEVVALGLDVHGFSLGDRVFFQGILTKNDYSTFQQYAKIPAALAAKTPSNISDDQASSISVATVAVVTAFYDKTGHGLPAPWDKGGEKAGAGKAIVVLGGSSSVGQYAIQFARLSGYEKIVTNSSAAHVDFLKSLGAHVILDRSTQSSPEDFKSSIGDLPLDFVFDAISTKETQLLGVEIFQATNTKDSHLITVQTVDPDAQALGHSQELKVEIKQVLGIGSSPALRHISEPLFKYLGGEDGYIAKGLFVPNRPLVVPGGLNGLGVALDKNEKGVSGEKIVIRPHDN